MSTPKTTPEWQPIETARKDGTNILLLTAGGVVEGSWRWGHWCQDVIECSYDGAGGPVFACSPTHWMPLPPAPGATPPEQAAQPADVALLHRALSALEYHRDQTRPIAQTDAVIEALRAALAAKGGDHA